jgi:hypothetical protein
MVRTMLAMAIAMAILEFTNAFMIEFPAAAVAFGVMFAGFAWWFAKRGTKPPLIALGVLFLIELLFLPVYPRDTVTDWVMQGLTLVLSGLGLVGVIGTWVGSRHASSPVPLATG